MLTEKYGWLHMNKISGFIRKNKGLLWLLFMACGISVSAQTGGYYPPPGNPGMQHPYSAPVGASSGGSPQTPGDNRQPGNGVSPGYAVSGTPGGNQARPYTPGAPVVSAPSGQGVVPAPKVPFQLTPTEQAQVDAVLLKWEEYSQNIRTFETKFRRYRYVQSMEDATSLKREDDLGELKYAAPDKGMFSISDLEGKENMKWLCDGKSVYEYQYKLKQIDQIILPPEMQGRSITSGPLPFLFGSSAEQLKKRYYIRISHNVKLQPGQVMIEAYPKTASDSTEFIRADMIILTYPQIRPVAIKLYKPNQEQHVYHFTAETMQVNKRTFLPATWVPSLADKMSMKVIPAKE